jgi:hypothetical protein
MDLSKVLGRPVTAGDLAMEAACARRCSERTAIAPHFETVPDATLTAEVAPAPDTVRSLPLCFDELEPEQTTPTTSR